MRAVVDLGQQYFSDSAIEIDKIETTNFKKIEKNIKSKETPHIAPFLILYIFRKHMVSKEKF